MTFTNNKVIENDLFQRLNTDTLFELPHGSFKYTGVYDKAARFVEAHQSKNRTLWVFFVEQFKLQLDQNSGGWSGEFYGKMMRGACWIYKYTQDEELYSTLEAAVRYLLSCSEENGRISSYTTEHEFTYWDMWCRKYVLLGTQYFFEICRDEALKAEILSVLNAHLDYIIDRVGEEDGKTDILDTTTHNPWTWGALNSSSILEGVVRQYYLTGNQRYLDFASYIVRRGGSKWGNVYELALDGKTPPYKYPVTKAYEMTSFFEGVLEYYRATGDMSARQAFINFISRVVETDLTVIGSAGCTHELFDHSSVMQTEINEEVKQETCVTVTLMKALYQALCLTGEAKYADAMERAGYNAMLGAVNFNKSTAVATDMPWRKNFGYDDVLPFVRLIQGYTFDSYSPLYKDKRNRRVGGFRRMPGDKVYGCCACIGASGVAIMPLSSVMRSRDGIRINHLMPGKVTFDNITLTIDTEYPYGDSATIKIETEVKEAVSIGIRVPSFTKEMTINGSLAKPDSFGYSVITKVWESGEEIRVSIPKKVTAQALNGKVALTCGAIVLAIDERIEDVNASVSERIVKVEKVDVPIPVREAYLVTFDNGSSVKYVDYASAGSDWGHEKSAITVWADVE